MLSLEEAADIVEKFGYERVGDTSTFHGTGASEGETVYLTEGPGVIEVCWNNGDPDSYSVTRVGVNEASPKDFSDTFNYIWNYPCGHDVEHHDIINIVKRYGMYVRHKSREKDGAVTLSVHDAYCVDGIWLTLDPDGNVKSLHYPDMTEETYEVIRCKNCMGLYVYEAVRNKHPLTNAIKAVMLERENVTEKPAAASFDGIVFKSAITGKEVCVNEEAKRIIVRGNNGLYYKMFADIPPFFVEDIIRDCVYGDN